MALCCDHYRVFNLLVGRLFLKRFALAYQRPLSVCPVLSVCGIGVLWPNGWMDQNATWYGSRSRPTPHCVRWGPSSHPQMGHNSPPLFGCLLWPNGWVVQLGADVGLRSGHVVLYGDPAPPSERCTARTFGSISAVVKWSPISPTAKVFLHSSL